MSMIGGTVNISRTIWDDTAFKDQPLTEREAFMWLIMEASFKAREKRIGNAVVKLKRGELASSIRFMADAWKWQKSTVSRFLKRLEKRDMIGTASGTGVTVITICKYSEYQNGAKDSGTPKNQKAGQQRDSSGTNEKNDAKRIEKKEPKGSEKKIDHSLLFERFWSEYPRKVARGYAEKAFPKALKEASFEEIMAGVRRYAAAMQGREKTYIKHGASWLNGKCWTDVQDDIAPQPAQRNAGYSFADAYLKSEMRNEQSEELLVVENPFTGELEYHAQ